MAREQSPLNFNMSTTNPQDGSTPMEKLMQQLQTTFTQMWQKMKTVEITEVEPAQVKPVVILGTTYKNGDVNSEEIASAIYSRIWFTYRAGFEPIERAENGPGPLSFLRSMLFNGMPNNTFAGLFNNREFSTDVGWGCMIRTSQSLLANALQAVILGRDYEHTQEGSQGLQHDGILELFKDSYDFPLSLHNFIRAASELPLQVKPGEWFGPSAASLSIKRLCAKMEDPKFPKLNVFVSESCDLYDDEMRLVFSANPNPLLILFPIRLGIDKINAIYYPSLSQLLSLKLSVGIAGGKPSSSYYFFGYQGSQLLYLDPHNLQSVSEDSSTYHTNRCQMLPISDLDPSMVVGVLINNLDEFAGFKEELVATNIIVHFHEKAPGLRRKSVAADARDSEFVDVSDPNISREDMDDFIDVGEELSDEDHEDMSGIGFGELSTDRSISESMSRYDIVERPPSVTELED